MCVPFLSPSLHQTLPMMLYGGQDGQTTCTAAKVRTQKSLKVLMHFFDRTIPVSVRGCKLLGGGGILHLTRGLLSSVYSVQVKTLRLFVCDLI